MRRGLKPPPQYMEALRANKFSPARGFHVLRKGLSRIGFSPTGLCRTDTAKLSFSASNALDHD